MSATFVLLIFRRFTIDNLKLKHDLILENPYVWLLLARLEDGKIQNLALKILYRRFSVLEKRKLPPNDNRPLCELLSYARSIPEAFVTLEINKM